MSEERTPERLLSHRQVIPRWRMPSEAAREMEGLGKTPASRNYLDGWMAKLMANHQLNATNNSANELLETAFILGKELPAIDLKELATHWMRPPDVNDILRVDPLHKIGDKAETAIRGLRQKLSVSPHQPLAWTELSRQYLAVGHELRANRAMQCALGLAPSNRYVIRSAVRLYSRTEEGADHALSLLRRSTKTKSDPWLLAAEIAISELLERTSPYVKIARTMLDNRDLAPRHYSELAAAVGTLEHESGKHKKAKNLFSQALIDPTDNSIAQAVFVSQTDKKIVALHQLDRMNQAYEAKTRAAYSSGDFAGAMGGALAWLLDEPFDIKPALFGSYLSFETELAASAENIATLGLRSSPHHSGLLNNRAVANAYLGNLPNAFDDIRNSLRTVRNEPSQLATLGLIAYRMGFLDYGRDACMTSISWLADTQDPVSAYRASLYWLRESIRAGDTYDIKDLAFLKERINKLPLAQRESDLLALVGAVERELVSPRVEPMWLENSAHVPGDFIALKSSMAIPPSALERIDLFADKKWRIF